MKPIILFTIVLIESLVLTQARGAGATETGKHLFILSGQSNMQGHRPEEAFVPAIKVAFGEYQGNRNTGCHGWPTHTTLVEGLEIA